ncbi:forkhead box protein J1-B [Condylostylus longicornis]|uniref:forkhead box protein J1-B n=1 Tax=Condylostylus longicornis TaxID=2530218 RepID=UPI00244E233D|nr:forkhead box protein J1-B [Condylostylus longicornis]
MATKSTVLTSNNTKHQNEEELTSLTWLTELKNQGLHWPNSIVKSIFNNYNSINKKQSAADRFNKFIEQIKKIKKEYDNFSSVYEMDTNEKPPFNYSQIIGMAMLENGRMTLQQICSWIENKFAYYKIRKNWNNSIRHNLSLQFCFRKINRNKYEKGKGGYWELAMDVTKSERKRIRNRKSRNIKKTSSSLISPPQSTN